MIVFCATASQNVASDCDLFCPTVGQNVFKCAVAMYRTCVCLNTELKGITGRGIRVTERG